MRPLRFSLAVWLVGLGVRADDLPAPTLQTAVREAVAARKVQDSETKGSAHGGEPFRGAAANGGVLVGLEVGLGRAHGAEHVRCVRPVYRAGAREWAGPPAGDFVAAGVVRTVRAVARDGYAVGGLWVNAGDRVDGVCLMFHRVKDGQLDPDDKYQGHWLGTEKADPVGRLDGDGRPVVGLFGRVDGGTVRAVGVTFADVPRVAAPAAPAAASGPRAKSILEAEAEAVRAARAARAAAPAGSGGLSWALAVLGMVLLGGAGLFGFWVWRRRQRAREAAAMPALRPAPSLPSQWAPIRPGNVRLRSALTADESEAESSGKPPSVPATSPPLLRPGSEGRDVVWR